MTADLDSAPVRPAPTAEQVLRAMPLVVVRANSRGEAQPALRGGEDRQIAVLVDGVPITLAWDHRSDLSAIPLTAARSVTLHRGLSSLLQGPNALGGAVEIDIARGERADRPPPPWIVDAAADHTGARSAAVTAGVLRESAAGRWLLRAGAGYRGSDGAALAGGLERSEPAVRARLTGDGERRLNTDLESWDGFLSLRRTGAAGAWAALTVTGQRLERGVAPEAHAAEPRLWRYPFQARALAAASAGTGMRATPWGRGDLEASLGLDVGRTEIDEYAALDYATVTGGERGDDRTLSARLLADHTLGARGDLRAGAVLAEVAHDEVVDGGPPAAYRQRLWSLATETDWRLLLAVPLRVSLGVAADGADTPESGDKPPLGRLADWGARAGATAALAGGRVLAHGASSRRARFPALRELYSGALGRFQPNPALRPETETAHELGATWRGTRGELQIVGFHRSLDDAIARIAVATPAGTRFQRVNQGRVAGVGLEAVASRALGPLAVGGDVTLQRLRGRDGSGAATELEYEPAIHGRAWCEAPLPGGARLAGVARGAGTQRFVDLDGGGFGTLPASLTLEARLSRGFDLGAWRIDAALAVENLADQVVHDQAGLPQPGRTVRLQARVW